MTTSQIEAVRAYRPIQALVPAHWQSDAITMSDGAVIQYHRTGKHTDRQSVILLHGFQSAGLTWLRTAKALEATYDVIMPDFRGHGDSTLSAQGFTLDRLTEDIADLSYALGLEKSYLIGHSLGAEIAGRLAAAYPDLVRGVVLVDPPMRAFSVPPIKPGEPMPPWLQQWYDRLQSIKTQPHQERLVTALKLMPPNALPFAEEDYVPFVEAQARFNLDIVQQATTMDYRIASRELASRITCPLLLLTGNLQRGSGVTQEGKAAIVESGDLRTAISFEQSGHFVMTEQFDSFIEAVQDFLMRR